MVDHQMEKDLLALAQEVEKAARPLEDDHRGDDYQDYLVNNYLEQEENQSISSTPFLLRPSPCWNMSWCGYVNRPVGSGESLSVKDLPRRDHLESAKKYLKKLGVDFPADSSEWKQAKEYGKLETK